MIAIANFEDAAQGGVGSSALLGRVHLVLGAGYQDRVDRVAVDPMAMFLQDLRDCVLHVHLPDLQAHFRWHRDTGMDLSVSLDRDVLLSSWDRWSEPAREFLGAAPPRISVRQPVVDYAHVADELHRFLWDAVLEVHAAELEERNALIDELAHLLGRTS
jgi:hypothetical protein